MTTRSNLILLVFTIFLFACKEKAPTRVETVTLLETTKSWNGKELPDFPEGKAKVTVYKVIIPPKTRLPNHLHPVYTMGILTKGELTIFDVDNNKTKSIKVGEPLVEVVNTIHYGKNEGTEPAEVIVFHIGSVNKKTSIRTIQD